MYHAFIRRKVRASFAALGSTAAADEAANLSENVSHCFAGDSAIGGSRQGPAAFVRWLERVYRLLPDLTFEVQDVIVNGGPFATRVAVHWVSRATSVTGEAYVNAGVHLIHMVKGRITDIWVFTDTEIVARTMRAIDDHGVQEASMPPLS